MNEPATDKTAEATPAPEPVIAQEHPLFQRVKASPAVKLLQAFKEALALLLFFAPFVKPLLSNPPLMVRYSQEATVPPARTQAAGAQAGPNEPASLPARVQAFCGAPHLLRVELTNTTSDVISHLDLRLNAVIDVADVGVSSSYSRENIAALSQWTLSEGGVVTFPKLESIQPRGQVRLHIWGRFGAPLFVDPVTVSSDKKASVVEEARTQGFALLVAAHLPLITTMFVVYFVLVGLRRVRSARQ